MMPNLEKAAMMAHETLAMGSDPLAVLKKLRNVLLFPCEMTDLPQGMEQDSFTLVNKAHSGLQYIVLYKHSASKVSIARELAHVILEHDGNSPEDVWQEEANCFAYHYICPVTINKKAVYFRPLRFCLSWEMKDSVTFDSVESMKNFIADEQNRLCHFIGKDVQYDPADVELQRKEDYDRRTGWRNCFDVVLDGKTVGYCGE